MKRWGRKGKKSRTVWISSMMSVDRLSSRLLIRFRKWSRSRIKVVSSRLLVSCNRLGRLRLKNWKSIKKYRLRNFSLKSCCRILGKGSLISIIMWSKISSFLREMKSLLIKSIFSSLGGRMISWSIIFRSSKSKSKSIFRTSRSRKWSSFKEILSRLMKVRWTIWQLAVLFWILRRKWWWLGKRRSEKRYIICTIKRKLLFKIFYYLITSNR